VRRAVTTAGHAAEDAATIGPDAVRRAVGVGSRAAGGFHQVVQLVLGLLIVSAGVLFTLDNLHVLRARDYLQYWPVGLVVIGVAQIVEGRTRTRFLAGGLWILIGGSMLARRLGLTDVSIWAYWPLVFVVVGARLVWQAYSRGVERGRAGTDPGPIGADSERSMTVSSDNVVSGMAVMGGFGRRVTSQAFQRAELTAFMGGGKIDLRNAKLAGQEGVIDIFAIMGGFEIIVPDTWNVIVELSPFMGGVEDKTVQRAGESAPRVYLRGFVMMGGVEIKN
jgi:predicted membrane protein